MKQCEIDRLIESKTSCKKQKGLIFGVGRLMFRFHDLSESTIGNIITAPTACGTACYAAAMRSAQ